MLAQVLKHPNGPGSEIRLSTPVGQFLGTWYGDHPVEVNEMVDVEIDVRDSLRFDDLETSLGSQDGFEIRGDDSMSITGHVVDIDHQDVMTLSVGGALLSLEMEGVAAPGIHGALVTLVVRDLDVYPTRI